MVVLACALWVGLLAWANVRERRTEIGLLRALGKSSLRIASLFLGKATLLGFCGGLTGCLLGYVLARWLATRLLDVSLANFTPSAVVLLCTIAGYPDRGCPRQLSAHTRGHQPGSGYRAGG